MFETQRSFSNESTRLGIRDRLQAVMPFVAEPVVEAVFSIVIGLLMPLVAMLAAAAIVVEVILALTERLTVPDGARAG